MILVLTILLVWLLLSGLTAPLCLAVLRGGQLADRGLGCTPVGAGNGKSRVPSPRLPAEGMAEFTE